MNPLRHALPGMLMLLLLAVPALAHKVNLYAYVEGGQVYTESYFPDGRPVAGGRVLVYDGSGALLLEGITDADGLFRFAIPKRDALRIVIDASLGHRNEFRLKQSELEAGR